MAQTPATMYSSDGAIDYTPSSAVTGGDVVVIGTIPMIATSDIAANAKGSLTYDGIFKVPKETGAFTRGDAVYWATAGSPVTGDASSGAATSTASGNNLMGVAVATAASGDSYVYVALTAAKRTATIAGSVTADDITGSDSSLGIAGQAAAQGGAIAMAGGTSSTAGNAGGAITVTGGTPGATGVGGAVSVVGGAGGGTSGTGGAASLTGGAGTNGNAVGGAASVTAGAGQGTGAGAVAALTGGASGAGATGNGGVSKIVGGAALSTNGSGGAAQVTGGVATGTGTGGAVTITSGASAGAGGTAGNVTIDTGSAAGGTGGSVLIGGTNAVSTKIGTGAELAAMKAVNVSGTIAVAVPSITDPDIAKVDVDLSGMTFAPAIGDMVVAIPLEALPTNARLQGAWVNATDQVQITFGSEGGNVTGANKNFKFLLIDLT